MAISSSKEFIVFPNDNSGRVYIKEQAFTASGTWTVPAGVTRVVKYAAYLKHDST